MGWEDFTPKDEERLAGLLRGMAERARTEANYSATRFLEMLSNRGAKETVRFLLGTPNPSDGFTNMYLAGRLDLTLEWVVQDEPWRSFLTPAELRVAQSRTGPKT